MKRLIMAGLLVGVFVATSVQKVSANTTESPGTTVSVLTVAAVAVSVVNVAIIAFPPHGSKAVGVVGAATGTALIITTHFDDTFESGERAPFYVFGFACAAIGLIDYLAADNGPDHAILGMRVD